MEPILLSDANLIVLCQEALTVCWYTDYYSSRAVFPDMESFLTFVKWLATAGLNSEEEAGFSGHEIDTLGEIIDLFVSSGPSTLPKTAHGAVVLRFFNSSDILAIEESSFQDLTLITQDSPSSSPFAILRSYIRGNHFLLCFLMGCIITVALTIRFGS